MARRKCKPLIKLSEDRIALFWSHVTKRGPKDCWLWKNPARRNGYAAFLLCGGRKNGKKSCYSILAHRAAYYIHTGVDPYPFDVLHTCDVPACCNPNHLKLGTHDDNMKDMIEKGRLALGEDNGRAKLTNAQAREIRRQYVPGSKYETRRQLAKEYNVDVQIVDKLLRGDSYKHA